MNTVVTESSYKSKNWLKLVLLFLATFLVIFVGGLVMEIFANLTDSQKSQAEMAAQPAAIVIDPKLESDLAKVMNFDNNQNLADLKDPYLDRSGISRNENNPSVGGGGGGQTTSSKPTNVTPSNAKPVTISTQKGSVKQPPTGNLPSAGIVQKVVVKEDTITRILKRDEDIRLGRPVPPESEILAIEDLLPVGIVSGGNGQDEIMLYSQSADRTFSYTVGTKFYDGWLSGIQKDGAAFGYYESNKIFLKSWVRSIQPRSTTTSVVSSSVGQMLVTRGN